MSSQMKGVRGLRSTTRLVCLQMAVDVVKGRERRRATYLRKATSEQNRFAGQVSALSVYLRDCIIS